MSEPTAFLYPFIEADERDVDALLVDLAESARQKVALSAELRAATLERCAGEIATTAEAMRTRFARGGRLFVFGNGGSATDADGTAAEFRRHRVAATSLVADQSVVTALGNDIGFDVIFARQLIAHARPDDVALGISTSGGSANVLAAFAEAHKRGVLTVGVCGYDGGAMATSDTVDHCLVVRSDSVHRIQEAQGVLLDELCEVGTS